ncbi:DUF4157 domain-containing protein [Fodinicola acaciae]|uniref:eCIS core domain-containing protein n=1 Tax=Fodinicola acaciae TaxID=2681555 RepID=UPI0013D7D298|nr:DUF4157 domain-containing protein [Fodinicola acaciae]
MRGHGTENDLEQTFRPKGDRIERDEPAGELAESPALMGKAAAAGRTDVLGAAGMLGLQRAVGNAAAGTLMEEERSPVHDVVNSGGGSALDDDTRADMESRIGADFGDVRVHTDSAAHESAQSVNAHAYTVGNNIVFQRDKYDPSSDAGKHMLAHELTHVVQQRSGPVDGTDAGGGIQVSDPSDRFERDAVANADRVMSAPAPVQTAAAGGAGAAVQRCGDGSDHDHGAEVQTYVQRDEAPAEETEEDPTAQTFVQREGEEEEEAAE